LGFFKDSYYKMKKTILITGSSSGIGRAAAKLFQQKGWNVAATMRSPQKEKELTNLENVICPQLDVMKVETIRQAVEETKQKFGEINAVVNNAGYGLVGPFEAATQEQIQRQFSTNVFGLMNVTGEVIPYFRERKQGIIANIASIGGRVTFPLYSLYHGTKWAVEGFSESLQHELKPFNIKIKIIEPGPIKTDFYDRSMDIMSKDGLTAYDSYINRAMPNMNKAGETGSPPEKVAKVVYRAVNSNSWRLRYPAGGNASSILFLRKILSDGLFNRMVRMIALK